MTAARYSGFLVVFSLELGQHVGGVRIAAFGKTPQLFDIASLTRELNQLGRGVGTASICEPAKLFHVASLAREFDKLVDGIAVAGSGPGTQFLQVLIGHSTILRRRATRHEARGRTVAEWDGEPPNWRESSSRASSRRS